MQFHSDLLTILEELATGHTAAALLSRRAYELAVAIELAQHGHDAASPNGSSQKGLLLVSTATCAVEWRGQRCVLGPVLPFKLLHRLSRHPERFYTYELLMEHVWRCKVSDDAVRGIVKRLRHALRAAGMADLASAIRGQDRSYGIFLHELVV